MAKKKQKKQFPPIVYRSAGLLTAFCLRRWLGTLNYKIAYYDPHVDPASPYSNGRKIYIFWHEYILFPVYLRGHCNIAMLLSRHRDAALLAETASFLGFDVVRGSTARGGVAAIRELLRKSRGMHLTITPDGPRGPRRQLAPGPVFLSSKLGIPLVPMGYGYDRPWRMNSWDRFALPRPFSRARAVIGGEIQVPPHLDRDGLEHFRLRTEQFLTSLTLEAESWAAAGNHKIGEQPLRCRPRSLLHLHDAENTAAAQDDF